MSGMARADAPPVILASGSSARAALLQAAGVPFTIIPAPVDESSLRDALRAEGVPAAAAAVALAEMKAHHVASRAPAEAIVLGADQLLEIEGEWLEKPVHREGAAMQLRRLRGRPHRLISAVVAFRGGSRVWHDVDSATALHPALRNRRIARSPTRSSSAISTRRATGSWAASAPTSWKALVPS